MISEQISELLHLTRGSLVNLGLGLFPQNFTIKPSRLHYLLSKTLVGSDRSTAFALPRGFGKSTYAWELMAAWNILHRKYRYVMFIAATSTIAEDMFSNMKANLKSHPVLASCMNVVRDTGDRFFIQINGDMYFMACFGAGQQLRGKRFEAFRPDLVIMDDLEKTEQTRSEDQRKKLKDWFFADVLPLDKNARYFLVGTYLHEDCLLANIIENPPMEDRTGEKWATFRYGVLDYDTGKPTWPEKYDEVWVETERKKYIENGQIYRFNTEYMNVAVDSATRAFSPENVRFYGPEQLIAAEKGGLEKLIIVDPGIKPGGDRDPTVILTSAMDSVGNIWVIDIVRQRWAHYDILKGVVDAYRAHNPHRTYIESVQGQEYLFQDLDQGRWEGGVTIPITRVPNELVRMGKATRIVGLEDAFEKRKILIPASAPWWTDMCDEMITFPRGKHDDILDTLSYAKLLHVPTQPCKINVSEILGARSSTTF